MLAVVVIDWIKMIKLYWERDEYNVLIGKCIEYSINEEKDFFSAYICSMIQSIKSGYLSKNLEAINPMSNTATDDCKFSTLVELQEACEKHFNNLIF